MAKKKTKAGANMIASVMEAATADVAASVEVNDTSVDSSNEQANNIDSDNYEAPVENDILTLKTMEIKKDIAYDDVCVNKDEIVRLTKENEELKDKMASYIDNIAQLERINKSMQQDYDESLMKISELSFEVALLKASLKEVCNNTNTLDERPNSSQNTTPAKSTSVSYQYKNNGYSSWN